MRLSARLETYQTGLARVTYVLMCSKTDIYWVAFFCSPVTYQYSSISYQQWTS